MNKLQRLVGILFFIFISTSLPIFAMYEETPAICSAVLAEKPSVELIKSLIHEYRVDVNAFDMTGNTAIHLAAQCICSKGSDILKELVTAPEVNINLLTDNEDGETSALHQVIDGCYSIMRIDSESDLKDSIRCLQRQLEGVIILLQVPGIDANISDYRGVTPLHQAILTYYKVRVAREKCPVIEELSFSIVKALLVAPGIDVNKRTMTEIYCFEEDLDLIDISPLGLAAYLREPRVILELLKVAGIDISNDADDLEVLVKELVDKSGESLTRDMYSDLHKLVLSGALRRAAQKEIRSIEKKYESIFKRFEIESLLKKYIKKSGDSE